MRTVSLVAFGVIVALGVSARAEAVVCPVPTGIHPTIQDAVDDIGCTEITLGIQVYTESVTIDRSLTISGVSSTSTAIAGRVAVVGSSTVFSLADLQVDGSHSSVAGCFVEALDVTGGARMSGSGIVVVNGDGTACVVFRDGFESGDTAAWSTASP